MPYISESEYAEKIHCIIKLEKENDMLKKEIDVRNQQGDDINWLLLQIERLRRVS